MIEQNVLLLSAYKSNKHFFSPKPYYNVALNTLQKIKFSIKDLVTFTEKNPQWKTSFFCAVTALERTGLKYKADKSRSIVIIKWRSMNTTPFSLYHLLPILHIFHPSFPSFILNQLNF